MSNRQSLYWTCPTDILCTVLVQQTVSVLYMSNRQSLYCTCPTGSLCTVHVQQAFSVLYMSNRPSLYCTYPTGSLCTLHVQQAVSVLYLSNSQSLHCTCPTDSPSLLLDLRTEFRNVKRREMWSRRTCVLLGDWMADCLAYDMLLKFIITYYFGTW